MNKKNSLFVCLSALVIVSSVLFSCTKEKEGSDEQKKAILGNWNFKTLDYRAQFIDYDSLEIKTYDYTLSDSIIISWNFDDKNTLTKVETVEGNLSTVKEDYKILAENQLKRIDEYGIETILNIDELNDSRFRWTWEYEGTKVIKDTLRKVKYTYSYDLVK